MRQLSVKATERSPKRHGICFNLRAFDGRYGTRVTNRRKGNIPLPYPPKYLISFSYQEYFSDLIRIEGQ